MEKRLKAPVRIRFKNPQEAVDLYFQIEFKYFIAKLLYTKV
jgi:hypothetical protein